jgi:hypothetical protein
MKKPFDELKKIAINFKIKPVDTLEDVVSVDTLIKVLSDIKKSFYHFTEYEFLTNPLYSKYLKRKPKMLQEFLENFQLMVVDANIGSYQTALAPDVLEKQDPFFKDDVLEFKKGTFDKFKNDVAYLDYTDQRTVNSIVARYPEEHRVKFYKPFIETISEEKKYNLILLDQTNKILRKIIPPDALRKKQIVPIIKQVKAEQQDQIIKGYFRVSSADNKIELNKSSIKQVYDIEILQHDTYPYKPDTIRFEKHIFVLNEKLHCEIEFEDNQYIIVNNELDITVWGDTRDNVENAFCFSFYSMYKNYAEESDEKLSAGALLLKNKLLSLVKSYYNEA